MKDYNFKINGNDYAVSIKEVDEANAKVTVNGTSFKVEIGGIGKPKPKHNQQVVSLPGESITSATGSTSAPSTPVQQPVVQSGPATPLKSPLPGVIMEIRVAVGDKVTDGQHVMVLEAMKMENNIDAHKGGIVRAINVNKGDSVLEGDVLLTIE